jgi:uncharacterized damage-inducible protein DinB
MIPKQDLLKLAKKEFATTLKVLKAYPPERIDFRPHERSSDAIKLTSTFVFEMHLLSMNIFGDTIDRSIFVTYKPHRFKTLIEDFEAESSKFLSRFEQLPEEDLNKNVKFAGVDFTADEFLHFMLSDQIHHRGQLSVYVRMAGGKVPSIYGPSADDPETNL